MNAIESEKNFNDIIEVNAGSARKGQLDYLERVLWKMIPKRCGEDSEVLDGKVLQKLGLEGLGADTAMKLLGANYRMLAQVLLDEGSRDLDGLRSQVMEVIEKLPKASEAASGTGSVTRNH